MDSLLSWNQNLSECTRAYKNWCKLILALFPDPRRKTPGLFPDPRRKTPGLGMRDQSSAHTYPV